MSAGKFTDDILPSKAIAEHGTQYLRFCLALALSCLLLRYTRGATALFSAGGFTLNLDEIVFALSLPLMVQPLFRARGLMGAALWAYISVAGLSVLRGFLYDPRAVLFDFRLDMLLIVFWLLTLRLSSLGEFHQLRRMLEYFFYANATLCLLRIGLGYDFLADPIYGGPYFNDGRPMGAEAAMALGISGFVCAMGPKPRKWFPFFATALVLVSFQRTAIVAVFLGLGFVLFYRANLVIKLWVALAALAGLLILSQSFSTFDLAALDNTGGNIGGRSGTFSTRIEIWNVFLDSFNRLSFWQQLVGYPYGQRPFLVVADQAWQATLHSAYVGPLLNRGIVGSVAMSAVLAVGLLRYFKIAHKSDRPLAIALIISALVYGISYDWRGPFGITFGVLHFFCYAPKRSDLAPLT